MMLTIPDVFGLIQILYPLRFGARDQDCDQDCERDGMMDSTRTMIREHRRNK